MHRPIPKSARRAVRESLPLGLLLGLLLAMPFAAGCGVGPEPLMPTPVVYQGDDIDLMQMVPDDRRDLDMQVFFATNRDFDRQRGTYTNDVSQHLRLGRAVVRFGDDSKTWEDLTLDCAVEKRSKEVILALSSLDEMAAVPGHGLPDGEARTAPGDGSRSWFDAINAELERVPSHDIVVYIHGAKVDLYNGCAFAAEVDHFLGRRLVPVAFCWPTHQDIFSYIGGEDIGRAHESAYALAGLLLQLSERTTARRIHVVCWSAGGRVTSKALAILRDAVPHLDPPALQARFRLGTVAFAAADVEVARFMNRLRSIDEITRRVIITITDSDEALSLSRLTIGGGQRLGMWREESALEREVLLSTEAVEVVDVSYMSAARGFDIKGHRYWFQHPWASSDLFLAILFDLPAAQRGLVPADLPDMWGMPPDYPARVRAIVVPLVGGAPSAPAPSAGPPGAGG